MGYSRQDILFKCESGLIDAKTFYKQPFVNYNGRTTDSRELYTEVVAEFLCGNLDRFEKGIPAITRAESYRTAGHDGVFDATTPREEEKIAMEMFNQSRKGTRYDFVGSIIDYQVPLKNERADKAGKIDLLSYNGKTLCILELKKPDSDESMLRAVLEGFTYLKTVDKEKLLNDFSFVSDTIVKASPFVFRDSIQDKQMHEHRPWLINLMKLLDSKPYFIRKVDDRYTVEE